MVLAGGLGRRIGGSKAMVELCGRPLIAYPLAAMQAALSEVMVLAKADTRLPSLPGVTVWVESDPRRHPLVGIVEALSAAGGRSVLVCAADLPFVTAEVIAELTRARARGHAAVVASSGEEIQPLLGRYEPVAAGPLQSALDAGSARVVEAVRALPAERLEVGDPDLLFNINAPEDVLQAAAMMDTRRSSRT